MEVFEKSGYGSSYGLMVNRVVVLGCLLDLVLEIFSNLSSMILSPPLLLAAWNRPSCVLSRPAL